MGEGFLIPTAFLCSAERLIYSNCCRVRCWEIRCCSRFAGSGKTTYTRLLAKDICASLTSEERPKDWVTIDLGGVVIIDGGTAARREFSGHYDLRIWLASPRDTRVSRLMARGDTSGAEIKRWLPSEDRYIASHNPEARAHLVIDTIANISTENGCGWFVKHCSTPSAL